MRHRIGSAGVFAVVLLAACEPTVSPQLEPSPAPARTTAFLGSDAEIDRVLQALHPGRPVDPRDRDALRQLGAVIDRITAAPPPESSGPPSVSPAMERALRDMVAAEGDVAAITRILQRLAAERNAETR